MKVIVPKQDYVVMEPIKVETKLTMPENVDLKKEYASVISVGPKVKTIKMGDNVITAPNTIIVVTLEDDGEKTYYMAKEENIIGILKEKK